MKQIELKCMGAIEKDKNGQFCEAFTDYAEVISSVGSVLKSNSLKTSFHFHVLFLCYKNSKI